MVAEFEALSTDVEREVQEAMRSTHSHYYRCILMPALNALAFRSNNTVHRPVIDALAVLQANRDSRRQDYDVDEVPIEGVVPMKWRHIVIDQAKDGTERVNRIDYEVCVLRALRKRLRIKEIWVEGADRYRDPEQDLPADFDEKRDIYYDMLKAPKDAKDFIEQVQVSMRQWLKTFNDGLPGNPKVKRNHPADRDRLRVQFGHSLLGTLRYLVVNFAFAFYGFGRYHVLIQPNNPIVRTVLTAMVEGDAPFFFAIGANGTATAFGGERGPYGRDTMAALRNNLPCILRSEATDAQYQEALTQFRANPQPPGILLNWVCRDNVEYLDLSSDRLELLPAAMG